MFYRCYKNYLLGELNPGFQRGGLDSFKMQFHTLALCASRVHIFTVVCSFVNFSLAHLTLMPKRLHNHEVSIVSCRRHLPGQNLHIQYRGAFVLGLSTKRNHFTVTYILSFMSLFFNLLYKGLLKSHSIWVCFLLDLWYLDIVWYLDVWHFGQIPNDLKSTRTYIYKTFVYFSKMFNFLLFQDCVSIVLHLGDFSCCVFVTSERIHWNLILKYNKLTYSLKTVENCNDIDCGNL